MDGANGRPAAKERGGNDVLREADEVLSPYTGRYRDIPRRNRAESEQHDRGTPDHRIRAHNDPCHPRLPSCQCNQGTNTQA